MKFNICFKLIKKQGEMNEKEVDKKHNRYYHNDC